MTIPDPDLGAVRRELAGLPPERVEAFEQRVERWWSDLAGAVGEVYPDEPGLADDLLRRAASAYAVREPELHHLDTARLLRPDWLQDPGMFGYACYADRFAGDLAGVARQAPYLEELGVTYLHLMPLLTPRPGDSDGGYAVADFRSVRPDLGTVEDLRDLATTLRRSGGSPDGSGISLVLDLVLNHVAREHEWARRAAAGEQRYRDYFLLYPDRTGPDAFEATLPEVFPDFAPGSFTYDDEAGAWVWTTFNSFQWDLNWANPDVVREFVDLVLWLANLGVEVLRLDAIAFLWKRLGTNCQNQPEVHALTQVLRTVARIAAPALAFKAEAIVSPHDLMPYLGVGERAGRVSDLAYHNSLMVQVWSALATGDAGLAVQTLSALPPKPAGGTWLTYVRCHDDIGWAIDDQDAAAVGLSGYAHRQFLTDWYVGDFPGSWARGLTFQENPETHDRRTSGTAATLAGLQDEHGLDRVLLSYAVAAGWGGIPIVWSGDELAQPDDPHWADDPAHADDNRWAHRPALDRVRAEDRRDPATPQGRVFTGLARLARVRAGLPQLHGSVTGVPLRDLDPAVLGVHREHASGPLVAVYNVSSRTVHVPLAVVRACGIERGRDVLGGIDLADLVDLADGSAPDADDGGSVVLPPYAARWIVEA